MAQYLKFWFAKEIVHILIVLGLLTVFSVIATLVVFGQKAYKNLFDVRKNQKESESR